MCYNQQTYGEPFVQPPCPNPIPAGATFFPYVQGSLTFHDGQFNGVAGDQHNHHKHYNTFYHDYNRLGPNSQVNGIIQGTQHNNNQYNTGTCGSQYRSSTMNDSYERYALAYWRFWKRGFDMPSYPREQHMPPSNRVHAGHDSQFNHRICGDQWNNNQYNDQTHGSQYAVDCVERDEGSASGPGGIPAESGSPESDECRFFVSPNEKHTSKQPPRQQTTE
ncbi:hypothetical protein V5O48_012010 [Marasmius crinis-equi]|uniref:Uncharacterized protein n=1 Tax=Marasmius crinis-equi TaxID=585013 RepID=A0ABR3F3Z2_9AGAR